LSVFYRAERRNILGEKLLKRHRFSKERAAKARNSPGVFARRSSLNRLIQGGDGAAGIALPDL
jgi:hypothetical protein